MLRQTLIYLSKQQRINDFIRTNWLASRFASRFVAGDTLDTAVAAVRELNTKGITATLDLLGESVRTQEEARSAVAGALSILEKIAAEKAPANMSIKLTQLGFDLDAAEFAAAIRRILDRAKELGIFVRVDMEGSAHTQRTLDLFEKELRPVYGDGVGIVIQSYLRRSAADVERLIAAKAKVRLCKGAYAEDDTVAHGTRAAIDVSYRQALDALWDSPGTPLVATHDPVLINYTRQLDLRHPRPFEFQMLYGVRPDEQTLLARCGYAVRVYVPYGNEWYGYLTRRLAERPANLAFFLRAMASRH